MNTHNYRFFLYVHEAWDAIYQACLNAQTSIVFDHFILVDDKSGRPFINLFKEKVKAGITVKILLDAVGSPQVFPFSLGTELKEAGVEIEFFNTLIPGSLGHYTPWFFRDHRKVIVIDSTIGFTGGVCFQEHMREWRDTCVRIEGPVVSDMERSFYVMWARTRKERGERERRLKLDDITRPFVFLTNEPFVRRRFLYYELLERIKQAECSIYFTTPYFVPNRKLLRALRRAARRGVSISLLIPLSSDHRFIDLAARSYFDELLKAGVNIYFGGRPLNHTKAGTVDQKWGTLGSLNLDYVSLRYNFEANLVTSDEEFVSLLNAQFLNDCQKAQKVEASVWRKRSFAQKLLEFCITPVRFLL